MLLPVDMNASLCIPGEWRQVVNKSKKKHVPIHLKDKDVEARSLRLDKQRENLIRKRKKMAQKDSYGIRNRPVTSTSSFTTQTLRVSGSLDETNTSQVEDLNETNTSQMEDLNEPNTSLVEYFNEPNTSQVEDLNEPNTSLVEYLNVTKTSQLEGDLKETNISLVKADLTRESSGSITCSK